MKLAIVDGQRRDAQPGLAGGCPVCGAPTIAKCGEKNIWHWAHKSKRKCDHWWENETAWHRNWKNQFPVDWQEFVQTANDGEKHIADVKTDQGWVIEFQHSFIKPEERRSREAFYGNMAWVVDGLRRKNDRKQFTEAVRDKRWVFKKFLVVTLGHYSCRIVDEWSGSRAPVLFDFGRENFDFDEKYQPQGLWLLIPTGLSHMKYFVLVTKEYFISRHRKGAFNPQPFIDQIKTYEQQRVLAVNAYFASQRMTHNPRKRRHQSFQQYLARRRRYRRRF